MRLIRLTLKDSMKKALAVISGEFKTGDPGFTEDVYALLRNNGNGIPDAQKCSRIVTALARATKVPVPMVQAQVNKRAQILRSSVASGFFQALMADTTIHPANKVRRFFTFFKAMYYKYREAQCVSCKFLDQCGFGTKYYQSTTNIARVFDPKEVSKVHEDCPVKPQIDFTHQMAASMQQVKKMADQEEEAQIAGVGVDMNNISNQEEEAQDQANSGLLDDSAIIDPEEDDFEQGIFPIDENDIDPNKSHSSGGAYDGSHSGSSRVKIYENMLNKLSSERLLIFDLGVKFSQELTAQHAGKFVPTTPLSNDRDSTKIEGVHDLSKIDANQHGLPEEVFEARLETRDLSKSQNLKQEMPKKLLYLLIDNSGSMKTQINANKYGMLTRGQMCSVFSLAIAERLRVEGGILFIRYFATGCSPLLTAVTQSDYETIMMRIANADFNGGGTSIANAIQVALRDIHTANKQALIASTEVLLISDNEDDFHESGIKNSLGETELNALDISGLSMGHSGYGASQKLKRICNKYYKVDPHSLDIGDIVKVV
jgi:hypothetical protein